MSDASTTTPTAKKIDELYELIRDIEIAMMTTRRPDGRLVARPMATQKRDPIADLWFVTSVETHKVDELEADPNVALGYYNMKTYEWVSVSGTATVSQDRALIRRLHQPDWNAWFDDEGGARNGGPDDPRLALILVDVQSAAYMKAKHSRPRTMFEVAKGILTGTKPDTGREERLSKGELL
jgi:general stress protein 26